MRIVVFSDSHRNLAALERVVQEQPQADLFLHLGDGEREFEDLQAIYPDRRMQGVCGNCDWGSASKVVDMLSISGKKVIFAHGHTFGVKAGVGDYESYARNLGADIALFGHTHMPWTHYEDGLYMMNPGSVSFSNRGQASYGVVDITRAGIVLNIVPMDRRGLEGGW